MGQKLGEFPAGLRESRLISPQEGPGLDASLGGRERPAGALQQIQVDFLFFFFNFILFLNFT